MRRAAFLVDVEAVGFDIDGHDLGAELPQRLGRHFVGRAIGAIDDDPEARKRHRARQCTLGELDVAVMHTCLDQYYVLKDANALGGLKWIQKGGGFYSLCNAKLKG